jgi:FkbM family methyltransferase
MNLDVTKLNVNEKQIDFYYRESSYGDKGVIGQIFHSKDYDLTRFSHNKSVVNYYNSLNTKALIIDAGANIGCSAVWFSSVFEKSYVYAIEPDDVNFEILEKNTQHYGNKFNFHGGLSNQGGFLKIIDPGHSDWGFRTEQVASNNNDEKLVRTINVNEILSSANSNSISPFICKIDIEGAESFLFSSDCEWVDSFPVLILELHDWMLPFSGSSRNFFKCMSQLDFDFLYHGENVFLFNSRILKKFNY